MLYMLICDLQIGVGIVVFKFGQFDLGFVFLNDMCEYVEMIVNLDFVVLFIVDVDIGYGGFNMVVCIVVQYYCFGVVGLYIED